MTNRDVARAWARGVAAKAGNLKTDGGNLWSYGLLIGTIENGRKIVPDYTSGGALGFISQTTSKHVGLAKRAI
jgi:hypothetical protein